MVENPQILVLRVDGYTDSRGDQDHNIELSEARARSVMIHLIEAGVIPSVSVLSVSVRPTRSLITIMRTGAR